MDPRYRDGTDWQKAVVRAFEKAQSAFSDQSCLAVREERFTVMEDDRLRWEREIKECDRLAAAMWGIIDGFLG